jgi:hypothetical protein
LPQSNGEGVHALLYCYSEKIALTIRYVKKLINGEYLVEEEKLIEYSPSTTPNGKLILLFHNNYYKVIEIAPPQVFLLDAQPYAMIKYFDNGEEVMETVTLLNLHKE